MKTLHALLLLLVLVFFSCSSGSNDDDTPTTPTTPTTSENTWTIGGHTYKQNSPILQQVREFYASDNKPFSLIKTTTVTTSSNGLFSGVNFVFNTHEAGTYTVKSQKTMISDLNAKYMFISVINGNLQSQGVGYESVDGNTTVKVEIINGNFVITATDPIAMSKVTDTGLNAAATATFTCNKVK